MLVVVEVHEARPRNGGETSGCLMVGLPLELQRAYEAPASPRRQPALHQRKQTRRVTDNVREEPIYPSDTLWFEAKCTFLPHFDHRERRYARIERRLVNADDLGAQPLQHPGPATRAAAEIEAALARQRLLAQKGEELPELEVGAAGRRRAVLDEADLAIWKGARAACRRQQRAGLEQGPGSERRRGRRRAE